MSTIAVATKTLLRGRDPMTAVLTVASVAVPHAMLLAVVGGVLAFRERARTMDSGMGDGEFYVFLSSFAAVLLIVPILSMGAAAVRLGMSRRSEHLAIVRLIGVTGSQVRVACVAESLIQALVGIGAGSVLYAVTLPAWSLLSFQNRPMGVEEMWVGVAGLALAGAVMAILAALSAWIAVREVALTPLGVVRRANAKRVSPVMVVLVAVLVVAWIVVGGIVNALPQAMAAAVICSVLALILAGVNAVGAWSVGVLGRIMAKLARRPHMLIAGRRLADDPRSVWRSFGAVALVGFIVGCLYPVISIIVQSGGEGARPEEAMMGRDIQTGLLLTLSMTVVLAAVSTAVNQAVRLLDTISETRALSYAGAPDSLVDRARRSEVGIPATLIIGGAMGVGLVFLTPLLGDAPTGGLLIVATLGGFLIAAVGVILAASESTRALRSHLLRD